MNHFHDELNKYKYVDIGNNILIHIGHFKFTVGIGSIEIQSVEDGLFFGEYLKKNHGKKIHYRLLIDDIGIDPKKRAEIKEKFLLPKLYQEKFEEYNLNDNDIAVLFESSMRNKASRIISKKNVPNKDMINKDMIKFDEACEYERCVPQSEYAKNRKEDKEIYSIIDPYSGVPLILKEGPNPKCNLIIACSYFEEADHYDSILSFYNAMWEQRMYYGAMVAKVLFNIRKPIIDFYYYEAYKKPKLVIHHLQEFKYSFDRYKMKIAKNIIKSTIINELKDEYLSVIEGIDDMDNLKLLEKNIKNLIN